MSLFPTRYSISFMLFNGNHEMIDYYYYVISAYSEESAVLKAAKKFIKEKNGIDYLDWKVFCEVI